MCVCECRVRREGVGRSVVGDVFCIVYVVEGGVRREEGGGASMVWGTNGGTAPFSVCCLYPSVLAGAVPSVAEKPSLQVLYPLPLPRLMLSPSSGP